MRSAQDWLTEYSASHRHPTNELLHWLCVPVIVLSLLGLLSLIPVPQGIGQLLPYLNWASLTALAALTYYCVLSPRLALVAAAVFALMFVLLAGLAALPWPLWASCAVLFVLAWIGQFVGHGIEGRRASFLTDVRFPADRAAVAGDAAVRLCRPALLKIRRA